MYTLLRVVTLHLYSIPGGIVSDRFTPISLPGSERIGHLRSDRKSTEVQGAQPKKRMMSKRTKHRLAGNACGICTTVFPISYDE